jgi:predicted nucleic acid-binding protein
MIVVADTTPLNYLILIDEIELLPKLYRSVIIPQEVHRELQSSGTPPAVRTWASALPTWCEVRALRSLPDITLNELDAGERDAIQLALDMGVDTLLMDESEGRRAALLHHLKVTGTVAVLEKAAHRGLIDFRLTLERLDQTNFRLSASIRAEFLKRNQ